MIAGIKSHSAHSSRACRYEIPLEAILGESSRQRFVCVLVFFLVPLPDCYCQSLPTCSGESLCSLKQEMQSFTSCYLINFSITGGPCVAEYNFVIEHVELVGLC